MQRIKKNVDCNAMYVDKSGPDIGSSLSIEGSVNSRISAGGTARARVEEALAALEQQLGIHS